MVENELLVEIIPFILVLNGMSGAGCPSPVGLSREKVKGGRAPGPNSSLCSLTWGEKARTMGTWQDTGCDGFVVKVLMRRT